MFATHAEASVASANSVANDFFRESIRPQSPMAARRAATPADEKGATCRRHDP